MSTELYIDAQQWQHIQDELARLTGFSLQAFYPDGRPLSLPSNETWICSFFQRYFPGNNQCQEFCGIEFSEVLNRDGPMVFKCSAGLTNFALPLVVKEGQKIVLRGGQVFTSEKDFVDFLQKIRESEATINDLMPEVKKTKLVERQNFDQTLKLIEHTLKSALNNLALQGIFPKFLHQLLKFSQLRADLAPAEFSYESYCNLANLLINEFDVGALVILDYDNHTNRYSASFSTGELKSELPSTFNDELQVVLTRVEDHQEPCLINDQQQMVKFGLSPRFRNLYFVPVKYSQQRSEMFTFANLAKSDELSLSMISSLVNVASQSLRQVYLYSYFHSQHRILQFISQMHQSFRKSSSLKEFHQFLVNKIAEMMDAARCSLMLLDKEHGKLKISAAQGLQAELIDQVSVEVGQGPSGQVFAWGRPLLVTDITNSQHLQRRQNYGYKTNSFISIPLKIDNQPIGVLNVTDKSSGADFTDDDLKTLVSIGDAIALFLERQHYYENSKRLEKISSIDYLTGLYNRRYLDKRLRQEIARSERYKHYLSLIMLDIDNFKQFNDTYGHLAGDQALKTIAQVITKTIRRSDIAVRFGGEEFVIILPETDKRVAETTASRLMQRIEELSTKGRKPSLPAKLTVSIGVASYPDDARSALALLEKADLALIQAKHQGKDRYVTYSP